MRVPSDIASGQAENSPFMGWIMRVVTPLIRAVNGALTFGTGFAIDNVAGAWAAYVTSGGEDAIVHSLGVIPTGFILTTPPQSGVINSSSTPWTTSTLYLRSTVAGQSVRIFILTPPPI